MSSNKLNQIQIRPAKLEDAAGIAQVRVTSWRASYQGLVPREVLDDLSVKEAAVWIEAAIRSETSGRCNLVAQNNSGQIVGFALGGPERTRDAEFTGEVYAIYILPGFLRIGIGRRLMISTAGCLSRQGMNSMLIWVLAENPARKFYEAMGGIFVREQPITIGQALLTEVAYGWQNLDALLQGLNSGPNSP